MRASTNDKLISRRRRFGTYASFAGIAVLGVALVASFRQSLLAVTLAGIVIGFILAQYGNYTLRRWGRSPRPDQVIAAGLKSFDDRYHFYGWILPAPYVALTPQGVYSFVTRDQTGPVKVDGARWQHKRSLMQTITMFAQEGLGNPSSEALDYAERLQKWIKASLPDITVSVNPAVVFIDARAELEVKESTVPVMDAKGLKKLLRGTGRGEPISNADYHALEQLFDSKVIADPKELRAS